ncbi:MAG: hypothetical protein FWE80_01550 [Oscillospiraceae bacterium]|nr:hypothetical protein [Oscillospiraceae bacterium]
MRIKNSDGVQKEVDFADEAMTSAAEDAEVERQAADAEDIFVLKFKTPFEWQGKAYGELRFDWESVDGSKCLAIEKEMNKMGDPVILEEYNGLYLIKFAAMACSTEKIGSDAIESMRSKDFKRIKGAARSFFLKPE